MTTKTRTNNSDINESTGNHSESLVRCMADWIKEAHEAIENGDYAGAATCVRLAYRFEQQVVILEG
jgi:hypothetical protein